MIYEGAHPLNPLIQGLSEFRFGLEKSRLAVSSRNKSATTRMAGAARF